MKRNVPLERDRDVDIMRGVSVGEVMTRDPDVTHAGASWQDLAGTLIRTRHRGFPVPDRDGSLVGIVTYDNLKLAGGEESMEGPTVAVITRRDVATVFPQDPLSNARC